MNEQDFELLAILQKTKNITKAAELLFVSQSSLSKRINNIEKELGATIMIRSRSGIYFTPVGEDVCKKISIVSNELKLMREMIDIKKDHICGTLNAGFSLEYSIYILPEILSIFSKKYPDVNLNITVEHSSKLYQKLLDNTIDVGIVRGEYRWPHNKLLLSKEKICIILHPNHKDLSLEEVPFINRKTDSMFEKEISRWMHEYNIIPKKHSISVDNISNCVEMVNRGLGWSIVPEICLNNFNGEIRPIYFKNKEPLIRATYLMYKDDVVMLPQVNAFIDTIKQGGL